MRVVGEPTGHPHPPSHEFKLLYFKYIVKIPKIGLEIHHLSWFWENNPFELSGKQFYIQIFLMQNLQLVSVYEMTLNVKLLIEIHN